MFFFNFEKKNVKNSPKTNFKIIGKKLSKFQLFIISNNTKYVTPNIIIAPYFDQFCPANP